VRTRLLSHVQLNSVLFDCYRARSRGCGKETPFHLLPFFVVTICFVYSYKCSVVYLAFIMRHRYSTSQPTLSFFRSCDALPRRPSSFIGSGTANLSLPYSYNHQQSSPRAELAFNDAASTTATRVMPLRPRGSPQSSSTSYPSNHHPYQREPWTWHRISCDCAADRPGR